LVFAYQEQTATRPQVHRPEDDPTGVLARQPYHRRLASQRPSCPQGWKQQEIGFVLSQQHAPGLQSPDLLANTAFFSPPPGRGPGRSEAVSTRSPAGGVPAGSCRRKNKCPWRAGVPLATKARSSSRHNSLVRSASGSGVPGASCELLPSTRSVVRGYSRESGQRDHAAVCNPRSSSRPSAERRRGSERPASGIGLGQLPAWPKCDGTGGHLGCDAVGFGDAAAAKRSGPKVVGSFHLLLKGNGKPSEINVQFFLRSCLALSDDVWLSIDHNAPQAFEEGVQFKRAYNEKMAAFDTLATELSVLIQQYTAVRLEAAEQIGAGDRERNERIVAELNREEP